jgi:hypothetical protein
MVARLVIALLLSALPAIGRAQQAVRVDGYRVTLSEFNCWLEVPHHWSAATLPAETGPPHFEPEDLKKLRTSTKEWHQQYSEILNSFLPFEALVFQAGTRSWHDSGGGVSGRFVRIYVSDFSAKQIWQRLNSSGAKEIERITAKRRGVVPSFSFEPFRRFDWDAKTRWEFVRISFAVDLWFGDYGGRKRVDLYAKEFGKQTIILAFFPISADDAVYGREDERDYQHILDRLGGAFLEKL